MTSLLNLRLIICCLVSRWTRTLLAQWNVLPGRFQVWLVRRSPLIIVSFLRSKIMIVCIVILVVLLFIDSLDIESVWIDVLVSFHDEFLTLDAALFYNTGRPRVSAAWHSCRLLYVIFWSSSWHQSCNLLCRWWVNSASILIVLRLLVKLGVVVPRLFFILVVKINLRYQTLVHLVWWLSVLLWLVAQILHAWLSVCLMNVLLHPSYTFLLYFPQNSIFLVILMTNLNLWLERIIFNCSITQSHSLLNLV